MSDTPAARACTKAPIAAEGDSPELEHACIVVERDSQYIDHCLLLFQLSRILNSPILPTSAGPNARSKNAQNADKTSGKSSEGRLATRLVMCPECGVGAEAKAGKKGGPSLQCRACAAFFHEVDLGGGRLHSAAFLVTCRFAEGRGVAGGQYFLLRAAVDAGGLGMPQSKIAMMRVHLKPVQLRIELVA